MSTAKQGRKQSAPKGRTARSKPGANRRKTPAGKPATKSRQVPQIVLAEMMAADIQRAGFRMSILFFALCGIITNIFVMGGVVWFAVLNYQQNDRRLSRHAVYMASMRKDTMPRLAQNEKDIETLTQNTYDRWSRSNMIVWCIAAQKQNKGFVCPSPIKIAPRASDAPRQPINPRNPTS